MTPPQSTNQPIEDPSNVALLKVENLCVEFKLPRQSFFETPSKLQAVRDVSFEIAHGEALGLVGESGSGKTTTAMSALRLITASSGKSYFRGENLFDLAPSAMQERRKQVQFVFQDPFSSLNPRHRAGHIVREPLDLHQIGTPAERYNKTVRLFETVGLHKEQMSLFPHQFSGGQRQRISIARALSLDPALLVCDEPVSALDVAIQAQLLNLFRDLRDKLDLSLLFISHDLGVVQYLCDRVAVMYMGEIVEIAPRSEMFSKPRHPYTKSLLDAVPTLSRRKSQKALHTRSKVAETSTETAHTPQGCAFAARCAFVQPLCMSERPKLQPSDTDSAQFRPSQVACHFPLN